MMMAQMSGQKVALEAARPTIHNGIVDMLRKQAEAGIDIISHGELGKVGFGTVSYYRLRLSGLTNRKLKPSEPEYMTLQTGERLELAEFYKELPFMASGTERTICSGPIQYIGQEEVRKDLELIGKALAESGVKREEKFMCVLAPGWLEHFFLKRILLDGRRLHFRARRRYEARAQGHHRCGVHSSNRRSGFARYV